MTGLERLVAWLRRLELISENLGEWRSLSDLPFSNRQRLCELEQDMGSSLVETLRSHP
jgi:hypothetical protein